MVRSRGESSATGDAPFLQTSVPEIGPSLQHAREQADLTLAEAAEQFGLRSTALEALESGGIGPQHDRIETLRSLRAYANGLGLPGDEYVLVALEQWPVGVPTPATNGDTAVVPVVSISSAPAGGHSPIWTSEATGVADATTTGVFEPVTRPVLLSDTGQVPIVDTGIVPIVDTGPVPAVALRTPRILRVLVGLVAFLIVVGGVALLEHNRVDQWFHDARSTTAHWYDNAKVAAGITSTPAGHTPATTTPSTSKVAPKAAAVHVVTDPSGLAATFNVSASSLLGSGNRGGQPHAGLRAGSPRRPEPRLHGDELHDDQHRKRGGARLHLPRVRLDRLVRPEESPVHHDVQRRALSGPVVAATRPRPQR